MKIFILICKTKSKVHVNLLVWQKSRTNILTIIMFWCSIFSQGCKTIRAWYLPTLLYFQKYKIWTLGHVSLPEATFRDIYNKKAAVFGLINNYFICGIVEYSVWNLSLYSKPYLPGSSIWPCNILPFGHTYPCHHSLLFVGKVTNRSCHVFTIFHWRAFVFNFLWSFFENGPRKLLLNVGIFFLW